MPPRGLALNEVVESDAQHSGNELQEGKSLTLSTVAEVGCQRLSSAAGRMSAPIEFEAQRRRKAFFVFAARQIGREGLSRDDRRKHASLRPCSLERFDFGIGPARLSGRWRAENEQELRSRQRRLDFFGEVAAGGQFLLIAEDR